MKKKKIYFCYWQKWATIRWSVRWPVVFRLEEVRTHLILLWTISLTLWGRTAYTPQHEIIQNRIMDATQQEAWSMPSMV